MAKLIWDATGERIFESGVDHAVLYPRTGPGVAWNGLISVTESPSGGEAQPYYLDGYKYHNEAASEEFEATISAYTYPEEFANLDGSATSLRGLTYGQQPRDTFGLSYRTLIGDDVVGVEKGYKIHLIYNALTSPTQASHISLNNSPEADTFSWGITAKPMVISARKPTAHIVVNSTDTSTLNLVLINNILYGTMNSAPRMPTPQEIVTLFDDWARLEIVPAPSTGLVQLKYRGKPDLKGDGFVGLYEAPDGTRLTETAISGLYKLE